MLSILIPEYKTDIRFLVSQLREQALQLGVPFEIIVLDDASDGFWQELNSSIMQFENCIFQINKLNCGRALTRNKLALAAQYNWLLFLDADVRIANGQFLSNYLEQFQDDGAQVIYGACVYPENKPFDQHLRLHWLYGSQIENPKLSTRFKNPYDTFHTVNFAVDKKVLLKFPFNDTIKEYGFEDHVWAHLLEENGIAIKHIDNPVVHEGIYTTKQFLRNTVSAVKNIIRLKKSNKNAIQTKFTKLADYLRFLRIDQFYFFLYRKLEKKIIGNLRSPKPNLYLLQFFKLGIYFRFWGKT